MITEYWVESALRVGGLARCPRGPKRLYGSSPRTRRRRTRAGRRALPMRLWPRDCLHFPQRPKLDIYGDLRSSSGRSHGWESGIVKSGARRLPRRRGTYHRAPRPLDAIDSLAEASLITPRVRFVEPSGFCPPSSTPQSTSALTLSKCSPTNSRPRRQILTQALPEHQTGAPGATRISSLHRVIKRSARSSGRSRARGIRRNGRINVLRGQGDHLAG